MNTPASMPLREQPLLDRAQRAVTAGRWAEAAATLQQAAWTARQAGRQDDAAHALQMAASLYRAAGDPLASLRAAQRLKEALPQAPLVQAVAAAERAETLFAASASAEEFAHAAKAWCEALQAAQEAGLDDGTCAQFERRTAEAQARAGQRDAAWARLDAAAARLVQAGREDEAAWFDAEQARIALAMGETAHVRDCLATPRLQARRAQDRELDAVCWLALGRLEAAVGELVPARQALVHAQAGALESVAPVTYYESAAALADCVERLGERVAAYGVLATAWVTLADLLGRELVRDCMAPLLEACRLRWGTAGFTQVKAAWEAQRRAQSDAGH
jgi:tetratricopeptide (TPR) repeat protein